MVDSTGADIPGMKCIRLIGSGGFADVYLYEMDQPRIKVAVKIMKSGALSESQRRQFTAEADTMAMLSEHPFIVPVLGAGTSADGRPYLVMTYYPSSDLAARVAKTPMTVAEALRYGIQLASAVETAHRSGIIHRDIKPSNILLTSYGVMGLSDFGVAGRPADASEDEDDVGISLPWSPREVATGESNGSVQSDVYSLAATVWHLLVGHAPFHVPAGDNTARAMLARIIHEKVQPLTRHGAPPSLDRLLQQAMAKDPGYRPATAMELARGFQHIEQELRLGRTEIVVLGGSSTPSEAAPVLSPPSPRPGDDPGPAHASAAAPATELRPTRVVAQTPASPIAGGAAGRTETKSTRVPTEKTVLRPARVPDESPAAIPEEVAPSNRWLLAAGAAVVLVAIIGVGFVLSGGGEGGNGGTTTKPPTDTHLPGVSTLPAPTHLHIAKKSANAITFTWDKVTGATGYYWLDAQGNQPQPSQTTPRAVVPRSGSATPCITAYYVKGGENSAPASNCTP